MWELNDYWGEDDRDGDHDQDHDQVQQQNSSVSPISIIPSDVHVLLVDHDRESLASLSNMLQLNSYKGIYIYTHTYMVKKKIFVITLEIENFSIITL